MNGKISSTQLLAEWIASSHNTEFNSAENSSVEDEILKKMKLTNASVMGCVLKDLGYILCGDRHIRIFGGKNSECNSFFDINVLYAGFGVIKGVLLIADMSNGGIFGVNCENCNGTDPGEVVFLPYGSLVWERLGIAYSDFVRWAINVKKKDLMSGGWIDSNQPDFALDVRDKIVQGKIGILLAMQN